MPEYIEREALIKRLEASPLIKKYLIMRGSQNLINGIFDLIKRQPTVDVVEVVRCKDCEHWGGVIYGFVCRKFSGIETKICMHADDFCSYGKRKEVDNGHP